MASPYTCKFPLPADTPIRVRSTFSESICRKVNPDLRNSTKQNARAILISPVRLTRLEKEELVAVLGGEV